MHFIQPIELSDNVGRCVNEGESIPWRTAAILSGNASNTGHGPSHLNPITPGEDTWGLVGSGGGTGSVEFGVNCVSTLYVNTRFDRDDKDDAGNTCSLEILVDGVQDQIDSATVGTADWILDGEQGAKSYTINLTNTPCGSVIKIIGTMTNADQFLDVRVTTSLA